MILHQNALDMTVFHDTIQLMDDKRLLFDMDGRLPPLACSLPLALQHLVAMIVGCVTPAIIISSVAGLDSAQRILLIQSSLVCAALSTLLQLFGVTRLCGARLPVIMGVSFAYLATMQSIATTFSIAEIFGAQLVGSLVAIVIGIFAKRIQHLFPPLITGTVVFTIGLSLYPTAITYMAGGSGNPDFGSWQNWLVAIFTLVCVTSLNHFAKGLVKLASILLGIVAGYVFSIPFGMIDLSAVGEAGMFSLVKPAPFGIRFEFSSILAISILFAINAIQAIGDMSATTIGGMDREPTSDELRGGIIGFGVSNLFSSLLGGLPNATYSQNVGIVSSTKVVNRRSAVRARRSDGVGVRIHRDDGHEARLTRAHGLPQHFDSRTVRGSWNGSQPCERVACAVPAVGDDGLRIIPCRRRDARRGGSQPDPPEG